MMESTGALRWKLKAVVVLVVRWESRSADMLAVR